MFGLQNRGSSTRLVEDDISYARGSFQDEQFYTQV